MGATENNELEYQIIEKMFYFLYYLELQLNTLSELLIHQHLQVLILLFLFVM